MTPNSMSSPIFHISVADLISPNIPVEARNQGFVGWICKENTNSASSVKMKPS